MSGIAELYYWIFNKPYYKVLVVKDMEKIKYLTQRVDDTEKGKNIAIVDRKLKKAWFLLPEVCFRDAKKFMMTVDLDNAIPLVEDTKIITDSIFRDTFIREISIHRLTKAPIKLEDIGKYTGKPKKFKEVTYPPTVLFEELENHFLKETLANPPSKWAELRVAIIIGIIGIVVIVWMLLNSGVIGGGVKF